MNAVCRKSTFYKVIRFVVPEDKVSWSIQWKEYCPQFYSAPHLKKCDWADPEIDNPEFKPNFNDQDGGLDRRSYDNSQVIYEVENGYPLNPKGRTGLRGRGNLGRWGPNHAADALVTRWKKHGDGEPILQFISIKRSDCGLWAIPGGFVNPGEDPKVAAKRELSEEAVLADGISASQFNSLEAFFSSGKQIYKGYVDDPRNTDNAWIETTLMHYHDEEGEVTKIFKLNARDDAADASWVDITKDLSLSIYPPHTDLIKKVMDLNLVKEVKC